MDQFQLIANHLHSIYVKKNADYGDSFKHLYERFGITSSVIRLSDKVNRLCSLTINNNAPKVTDESIDDTLIDIANYAILTLMERDFMPREHTIKVNEFNDRVCELTKYLNDNKENISERVKDYFSALSKNKSLKEALGRYDEPNEQPDRSEDEEAKQAKIAEEFVNKVREINNFLHEHEAELWKRSKDKIKQLNDLLVGPGQYEPVAPRLVDKYEPEPELEGNTAIKDSSTENTSEN